MSRDCMGRAEFEDEARSALKKIRQADIKAALEAAWTDFCDSNPDDLNSPEDLPDHALMTCNQFVRYAMAAIEDSTR